MRTAFEGNLDEVISLVPADASLVAHVLSVIAGQKQTDVLVVLI